jgi:hypothetical protein
MGGILKQTSTQCYAWSLMPNHFHLLLRTCSIPISTVMSRLLTGYAVFFNRRHHRHGHLFQNRFKSIICQEDSYLLELVRYIHLNPLRAGIVPDINSLNRFLYSGHATLIGFRTSDWQETTYILGFFGRTLSAARKRYAQFVKEGADLNTGEDYTAVDRQKGPVGLKEDGRRQNDERILGDSDFVNNVLRQAENSLEHKRKYRREGLDFTALLQRIARMYALHPEVICGNGKQPLRVEARSVLCCLAVRELGYTATSVAAKLRLTQPAVSRAVYRGEQIIRGKQLTLADIRKA